MAICVLLLSFFVMLWKTEIISAGDTVFRDYFVENNSSTPPMTDEDYTNGKHESLLNCDLFELEPDEFVIFSNGSAFVPAYNQTYDEPFYFLINDSLIICAPKYPEDDMLANVPLSYLSLVGVVVSMVCCLAHLIVFSFVSDLQNLPGYNLASLCASLFMSYLFMIIAQTQQEAENTIMCTTSGVLTHFFFLASFLWMFVMAFDVFRSILLATGSMRASNKEFKVKKFVWYSLFSWLTALAFAVAAVVADNVEGIPQQFRPMFYKSCWFDQKKSLLTFFAIPMCIITCLNFVMFGISAFLIFTNRMKSSHESQRSHLKKNHLLYFRLTVIMGVTWITGVLAPLIHVLWLWYVFAALNTFQGLFIFLAFTCSPKVKKFIKDKLFGARRPSQQTSPTFQSYCYYANSIEKDLDKVIDSKDKSEPIDTIVIHL
ncbi:probable G-protein coupled receptor Mth-like 3 [Parasteatoda tepidariorum]|uniref:probable G-protein coupled receptor Mth-like 3 n=1 Tax=Parasteatoda tepidariorum TaxID=114398 RepID=UPI001C718724|nr:probable G-protein coupled receptor Mth-like 3 [Parasteatoda tepidariorum]